MHQYRKDRVGYLEANQRCVSRRQIGCTLFATEVHHRRGRVGRLLLDQTHWAALCHGCHSYYTEHPAEAYESGISERRIGSAS